MIHLFTIRLLMAQSAAPACHPVRPQPGATAPPRTPSRRHCLQRQNMILACRRDNAKSLRQKQMIGIIKPARAGHSRHRASNVSQRTVRMAEYRPAANHCRARHDATYHPVATHVEEMVLNYQRASATLRRTCARNANVLCVCSTSGE